MPKDKKRSISYRSFVTCNDPKGVIECRAIRKITTSAISPKKREQSSNIEEVKKEMNQNPPLAVIKEKEKVMGTREITRELKRADKLNPVINSLSIDREQQKEIAFDLLKGALDLQESLVMLRKAQEGSCYARKERQKFEERRFDGMMKGMMMDCDCHRGGFSEDEKVHMGFQKPRHSVEGSSRKSFDGVREVVRDSILRQNVMISNPIFEEHFDHRKFGSPGMPSTSSNQSLMVSDTSVSSTVSKRKDGKELNLIVKLMGLESFPASPRKHREAERIVSQAKPIYDIDSPRARKPKFVTQEIGVKQRTVDEILETLNFKGLLRTRTANELTSDLRHSKLSPLENRWTHERPPIVVLKPMRFPCLDLKQPIMPMFQGDCATAGIKESPLKPKPKGATPQVIFSSKATNSREKCKEVEGGSHSEGKTKPMKKKPSSKAKKPSVPLPENAETEQAAVRKVNEVVKETPSKRKGEEEKIAKLSGKELRSRDQAKLSSSKVRKQKDGTLISKSHDFGEEKTTSTAILEHKTKETSKSSIQRIKPKHSALEGQNQRCKGESKNVATFKEEIDPVIEKDAVLPLADTMIVDSLHSEKLTEASLIQITDYDDQSSLSDTWETIPYLHNDKKVSVCVDMPIGVHESGNEHKDHPADNKSSGSDITSVSITEINNVGHLIDNHNPIPEVTLITTHENGMPVHRDTVEEETANHLKYDQHSPGYVSSTFQIEDGTESSAEPDDEISRDGIVPRRKLKVLLLSSPSFMSHAEELFNLQVDISASDDRTVDGDLDVATTNKLLLDCATEIMEIRSLEFSQACLPLPRMYTTNNPRTHFSLDQLLEEVCDGIEEYLKCHFRPSDDNFSFDNLYLLLDQDVKPKRGTWDIGWRYVFSQEEVEKVIGSIDRIVLGKLIEEVVVDFMF